jgi:tetratricopeptide (TPR) repeat protein
VFSTALVAAAIEMPVEQVDEACDALARRALFLQHEGTEDWPDGSQQSCYGFTHGLVRDVCAERSAPARRQRWHRVIAERLEAVYGDRADEVSSILATHFEQGQIVARAIHFHILAGQRMVRRFASADALPAYRAAFRLLARVAPSRERDVSELRILGGMSSVVLRLPNAISSDDSITNFHRMIVLATELGDTSALYASLTSLSVRLSTLGRYREADAINAERAALAPASPAIRAATALPLFWQGKLGETIALLEPLSQPDLVTEPDTFTGILDPASRRMVLMSYLGAAYWAAGRIDDAVAQIEHAGELAIAAGDPYAIGLTKINLARVRFLRGDSPALIRVLADDILARPDTQMWHSQASLMHAWLRSTEAPLTVTEIDDVLRRFRERFAELPMGGSYVALHILDAMIRSQRPDRALAFADETLGHARRMSELMFEPELVRVRARLAPNQADLRAAYANAKAMGAWGIAIRIARDLGDPSLVEEAAAHINR